MERLNEFYAQENAILIDVRQPDEYAQGHIPGARSVPLQKLRDFLKAQAVNIIGLFYAIFLKDDNIAD